MLFDKINTDGLTPLTLAARLGFVDVFDAILERMGGNAWSFGEVPRNTPKFTWAPAQHKLKLSQTAIVELGPCPVSRNSDR